MYNYLDFAYTSDGKFCMLLAFSKQLHKYEVVLDFGKLTEYKDYYFKEELKVVV